MSSKVKRRTVDLEAALATMLKQAAAMADRVMDLAPDDRSVEMEELRRVETFVLNMFMTEWRENASEQGISPLAMTLMAKPFEDQFRQAFSTRFYSVAPLAAMETGGHA